MIYRMIFEVETVGSREDRNLRPKLSDETPQGINYRVLEYDETKGTCIVECWCSDHEILKVEHRKNMVDLTELASNPAVLKTLESHGKSPKVLGSLSITETLTGPKGKGKPEMPVHIKNVDLATKTLEWKGKKLGFKRRHETTDTVGRKMAEFIVDEG